MVGLKVLPANQQKEFTLEIINKANAQSLLDVQRVISEASNKGQFSCYYYTEVNETVLQFLRDLGYKLNIINNQKDGYTLEISWK